ncbi:MAG: carbon monoxide dehydrogenase subunit G [Thermoplasmata archaeon]|nr:carbon monoxide dehydrogenase subunit G [Thermoplasmata archaeon]
MHVEGDFHVRSARTLVWAFFRDPATLATCLEDPHEIHATDATHFEGTLTAGVAFIRGTFRLRGSYASETPPNQMQVTLQGSGMGSGVDAALTVSFAEGSEGTGVHWTGEIKMSGTIATVGERLVKGTVDKKVTALFEAARVKLEPA